MLDQLLTVRGLLVAIGLLIVGVFAFYSVVGLGSILVVALVVAVVLYLVYAIGVRIHRRITGRSTGGGRWSG